VQTVVEAISWAVLEVDERDVFVVMAGCLVKYSVVETAIGLLVALALLLVPIPLGFLVPLAFSLLLVPADLLVVLGDALKVSVQVRPTMVWVALVLILAPQVSRPSPSLPRPFQHPQPARAE
jgi:hypothetical protein